MLELSLWRILNRIYLLEKKHGHHIKQGWTLDGILMKTGARKHQLFENLQKLVKENCLDMHSLLNHSDYYFLTEFGREIAKSMQYELF